MVTSNPLSITSKKNSLTAVFIEIKHNGSLTLANTNCVRIFCLDINSNLFSYESLYRCLQKNIGNYVYSRARVERFKVDDEVDAIGLRAVELLRDADNPKDKGAGGELGEILLYLFLEQLLNAPKLLSKIELKTTGNQYIYGCDGVHILKDLTEDGVLFHQLVLGESKIKGNLEKAVDDAFDSILKFNINHNADIQLIDSNAFKEAFDEDTLTWIKSLIIPEKRDLSLNVDKAFGVFLGYTIDFDGSGLTNLDYRTKIKEKIKADAESIVQYIQTKIQNVKLVNNSFYFYILPFNDAPKDRADIINRLKGAK